MANKVGDRFEVTVLNDVSEQGVVIVPKGTIGHGEVTFSTKSGGFGKPGILGISLRTLDLNGKSIILDGRYREEGKDGDAAAGATWFAVGIFAGFVKGKAGVIPKGRELRARIGEDALVVPAPPTATTAGTTTAASAAPVTAPVVETVPVSTPGT